MNPGEPKSKRIVFRFVRMLGPSLFAAALTLISGCATSDSAGVDPHAMSIDDHSLGKVFCTVTSPTAEDVSGLKFLNSSRMLTTDFVEEYHEHLLNALAGSELFQVGNSAESSQVLVDITILRVDTGFEGKFVDVHDDDGNEALPSVYLVARWRIKKSPAGDVVCEKDITTAGTSSVSAADANIRAGIGWLIRRTQ